MSCAFPGNFKLGTKAGVTFQRCRALPCTLGLEGDRRGLRPFQPHRWKTSVCLSIYLSIDLLFFYHLSMSVYLSKSVCLYLSSVYHLSMSVYPSVCLSIRGNSVMDPSRPLQHSVFCFILCPMHPICSVLMLPPQRTVKSIWFILLQV